MARRRKQEEVHENHERWLVSYADFITLLFAFFVVMYAISQVNEGKYRVLSTSMIDAFRSGNLAIQATPPSGSASTVQSLPGALWMALSTVARANEPLTPTSTPTAVATPLPPTKPKNTG